MSEDNTEVKKEIQEEASINLMELININRALEKVNSFPLPMKFRDKLLSCMKDIHPHIQTFVQVRDSMQKSVEDTEDKICVQEKITAELKEYVETTKKTLSKVSFTLDELREHEHVMLSPLEDAAIRLLIEKFGIKKS